MQRLLKRCSVAKLGAFEELGRLSSLERPAVHVGLATQLAMLLPRMDTSSSDIRVKHKIYMVAR